MFQFQGASDDPTGVPGTAVTNTGATADEGLAAARALGRIAQQTQKGLCVTHGAPPRLQRWRAGTVNDGGDTAAGASSTTTAESTVCGTVSAKGSETASCATSTSMTPIPVAVPARAAADAILTGEGGSSKSVAAAAPNAEGEKTFSSTSILLGRAPSTNSEQRRLRSSPGFTISSSTVSASVSASVVSNAADKVAAKSCAETPGVGVNGAPAEAINTAASGSVPPALRERRRGGPGCAACRPAGRASPTMRPRDWSSHGIAGCTPQQKARPHGGTRSLHRQQRECQKYPPMEAAAAAAAVATTSAASSATAAPPPLTVSLVVSTAANCAAGATAVPAAACSKPAAAMIVTSALPSKNSMRRNSGHPATNEAATTRPPLPRPSPACRNARCAPLASPTRQR